MNEDKLTEITEVLEKINKNISSKDDFYENENTLERIIVLLKKQCDILERTEIIIERIEENLNENNYVIATKIGN